MYDKVFYCATPEEMVMSARKTIYENIGKLKYVNLKYKRKNEPESQWLYNINFYKSNEKCIVEFENSDENFLELPLDALEFLKIRPYYIAACVGFKNIIFYSHEEGVE